MRKNGGVLIFILFVFLAIFGLMMVYIHVIDQMQPMYTHEDVFRAVMSGNIEDVEQIYRWNPPYLFIADEYDNTLLHLAVKQNDLEMVKLLTRKGLLPNEPNIFGNSPLSVAVVLNHYSIAEYLLDRKFNPNAEHIRGVPLVLAVNSGNVEMVNLLLSKKADPNIHNGRPLLTAVENNNIELARILVYNGALAEGSRNPYARKPLCEAVKNNNVNMAIFLIAKGANVNAKSGSFGKTCLHVAAESGNLEMISFLINQGANPNIRDYAGYTPLDYAENNSYIAIVRILKPRTTVGHKKVDDSEKEKKDPEEKQEQQEQDEPEEIQEEPEENQNDPVNITD
jgi:ankyrin repeat protein